MEWRDLTPKQKFEEVLCGLALALVFFLAAWMPDLTPM